LPVPTNSVHTRRSPSAHPPLGAHFCTRHGSTAAYTLDTPTNAAGRHDLPCHLTPAQQREVIKRHGSFYSSDLDTPTNAAGRHDLPCHLTPAQQRELIKRHGSFYSSESCASYCIELVSFSLWQPAFLSWKMLQTTY
jgi:hypothetical protein